MIMNEDFNFGYESILHYLENTTILIVADETTEIFPSDEHNGGIIIKHKDILLTVVLNKINNFEVSIVAHKDMQAFSIVDSGDMLQNLLHTISTEFIRIL